MKLKYDQMFKQERKGEGKRKEEKYRKNNNKVTKNIRRQGRTRKTEVNSRIIELNMQYPKDNPKINRKEKEEKQT